MEKRSIVEFLNDYCETSRSDLGQLSSEVGVLDQVTEIVEDFVRSRDPRHLADIKRFENTEIYVEIMNGILERGTDWIEAECQRLQSLVQDESASQESLDRLQKRLNVLIVFLDFLKAESDNQE